MNSSFVSIMGSRWFLLLILVMWMTKFYYVGLKDWENSWKSYIYEKPAVMELVWKGLQEEVKMVVDLNWDVMMKMWDIFKTMGGKRKL